MSDIVKAVKFMFPEHLRYNPEYMKYIQAVAEQLGYSGDLIELFPVISHVEDSNEDFLPLLGSMIGYEYNYNHHTTPQRDIIKRHFDALSKRGTETSLLKTTSRGIDSNWYKEDLTYYRDKIKVQDAKVIFPEDHFFTLSKSKLSGTDRFPDTSDWTVGMIILYVEDISEALINAIYETLPTGRTLVIVFVKTLKGSDYEHMPWNSEGRFGEISFLIDNVLAMYEIDKQWPLTRESQGLILSNLTKGPLSVPGFYISGGESLLFARELIKDSIASQKTIEFYKNLELSALKGGLSDKGHHLSANEVTTKVWLEIIHTFHEMFEAFYKEGLIVTSPLLYEEDRDPNNWYISDRLQINEPLRHLKAYYGGYLWTQEEIEESYYPKEHPTIDLILSKGPGGLSVPQSRLSKYEDFIEYIHRRNYFYIPLFNSIDIKDNYPIYTVYDEDFIDLHRTSAVFYESKVEEI